MPQKRLEHYQICRVEEHCRKDKTLVRLQERSLDELRELNTSPDGTFIRYLNQLYLPKRKRGVKFVVTYTQVFQKEI